MVPDIIYEILKHLYLCPEENNGVILARKILLSQKIYGELDEQILKLEKPIVFDVISEMTEIEFASVNTIIYWGDRTIEKISDVDKITAHKYSQPALYTIKVFDYEKLQNFYAPKDIVQVHSIGNLTNLSQMFQGCYKLRSTGKKWDTSNVVDMNVLFHDCTRLRKVSDKNWNTSNVVDMSSAFSNCYKIRNNVGKYWDTSNVVNMSYMFHACINLDQNIGEDWDTSRVENMQYMFWHCSELNQPIGLNWNVSNVIDMEGMFGCCRSLAQPIGQNWNISNVKNMTLMFADCAKYLEFRNDPKYWELENIRTDSMYAEDI
jgi:hypothetical protein